MPNSLSDIKIIDNLLADYGPVIPTNDPKAREGALKAGETDFQKQGITLPKTANDVERATVLAAGNVAKARIRELGNDGWRMTLAQEAEVISKTMTRAVTNVRQGQPPLRLVRGLSQGLPETFLHSGAAKLALTETEIIDRLLGDYGPATPAGEQARRRVLAEGLKALGEKPGVKLPAALTPLQKATAIAAGNKAIHDLGITGNAVTPEHAAVITATMEKAVQAVDGGRAPLDYMSKLQVERPSKAPSNPATGKRSAIPGGGHGMDGDVGKFPPPRSAKDHVERRAEVKAAQPLSGDELERAIINSKKAYEKHSDYLNEDGTPKKPGELPKLQVSTKPALPAPRKPYQRPLQNNVAPPSEELAAAAAKPGWQHSEDQSQMRISVKDAGDQGATLQKAGAMKVKTGGEEYWVVREGQKPFSDLMQLAEFGETYHIPPAAAPDNPNQGFRPPKDDTKTWAAKKAPPTSLPEKVFVDPRQTWHSPGTEPAKAQTSPADTASPKPHEPAEPSEAAHGSDVTGKAMGAATFVAGGAKVSEGLQEGDNKKVVLGTAEMASGLAALKGIKGAGELGVVIQVGTGGVEVYDTYKEKGAVAAVEKGVGVGGDIAANVVTFGMAGQYFSVKMENDRQRQREVMDFLKDVKGGKMTNEEALKRIKAFGGNLVRGKIDELAATTPGSIVVNSMTIYKDIQEIGAMAEDEKSLHRFEPKIPAAPADVKEPPKAQDYPLMSAHRLIEISKGLLKEEEKDNPAALREAFKAHEAQILETAKTPLGYVLSGSQASDLKALRGAMTELDQGYAPANKRHQDFQDMQARQEQQRKGDAAKSVVYWDAKNAFKDLLAEMSGKRLPGEAKRGGAAPELKLNMTDLIAAGKGTEAKMAAIDSLLAATTNVRLNKVQNSQEWIADRARLLNIPPEELAKHMPKLPANGLQTAPNLAGLGKQSPPAIAGETSGQQFQR